MISVEDVTKVYETRSGKRAALDSVNLQIRKGEKVGILGRNGSGKSTLVRLISGAEPPTSGRIFRGMSVSWPLAFSGAFQGSLTGLDNLRFVCRVYGAKIGPAVSFVREFSELGNYLYEPVKKYSSGMRARLAFALSMAIEFDCFLIDEIAVVGDSRFHDRCRTELFEKRKNRAMVIVSHDIGYIREHCDRAAVLVNGRLYTFEETEEAFSFYKESLKIPPAGEKAPAAHTGMPAVEKELEVMPSDLVKTLFNGLLGRDPGTEEVEAHMKLLVNGGSMASLLSVMTNSAEFKLKNAERMDVPSR